MSEDAEYKFKLLIKDMMENTDYLDDLGLDRDHIPEFEFLKEKPVSRINRVGMMKNSRLLKIAGFLLAVFVVSGLMTIAYNSDVVTAGIFQVRNVMFGVMNGVTLETQSNTTSSSRELVIENEEQIPIGKKYLKELKTPGYIPEGYAFSSLSIKNNPKNEYVVIFVYKNMENDDIIITQERLTDYNKNVNVYSVDDEYYIGDTRIIYANDIVSGYSTINASTEFEVFYISGLLELTDLMEIFNMLE